jgi:hypothetical protein
MARIELTTPASRMLMFIWYPLKFIDALDYDLLRLGIMQRWFRSGFVRDSLSRIVNLAIPFRKQEWRVPQFLQRQGRELPR